MSSNQEVNPDVVDSKEVENLQLPIRLAISESACKTFNFVWNIGNFELLSENWFNFRSTRLEIYPSCCYVKFEIQRELAQKQSEDGQNSWIFTIEPSTLFCSNNKWYNSADDEHLREVHYVKYVNNNQYLMGSNGEKKFLENGSSFNRKFVIQLSDDQLKDGSDYLNSGFLEFRMDLQLIMMLSRKSRITISKSLNPIGNIAGNFGDLFESQVLSDLIIETVDESSFKAHKAILAARSPVFEKMFTIDMKEKEENLVKIHGADSVTMKVFLKYIYEDKLKFDDSATIDQKFTVLQLADQYQISRLKALCELELIKSLNADSIFKILVAADTLDAKNVRECGIRFVKLHKSTLIKHEDIRSLIGNSQELGGDILEALTCV